MILRKATLEDAEDISVLVNSAYRGELSGLGWTTEADLLDGIRTDPDQIRAHLNAGQVILTLTDPEENKFRACVLLEKTSIKDKPGCYLGMLTVHPTLQDKGFGRRMLSEAEKFAREEWHAEHMILGVIQLRDTLIEWYKRRGYTPNGETKPFPYGRPEVGIPKRDDMYFIFFEKAL